LYRDFEKTRESLKRERREQHKRERKRDREDRKDVCFLFEDQSFVDCGCRAEGSGRIWQKWEEEGLVKGGGVSLHSSRKSLKRDEGFFTRSSRKGLERRRKENFE